MKEEVAALFRRVRAGDRDTGSQLVSRYGRSVPRDRIWPAETGEGGQRSHAEA
jgi:hypothetical protein